MNERIKTLWEATTCTCIPREGDYVAVSSKNIQAFTAQIIKECAKIANQAENNYSGFRCMYDVVIEHFGIKE